MKMKEREAREHFNGLSGLGNLTLPSKLGFAITCNLEKLQKESERIEKERKKLCEQFADKDEEGKPVMIDSMINGQKTQEYKMTEENKKLFSEEYEALPDSDVDIEIRTVKSEEIERCEKVERYDIPRIGQLMALSFMLKD